MTDHDTRVEALMSAPVVTVSRDATIAEAARLLTRERIGYLVVGEEHLKGIITKTDVVRARSETPTRGSQSSCPIQS